MTKKINADFEILFHPDLDIEIKEVRFLYSLDEGKSWDDYYANKLGKKRYNITIYDLPEDNSFYFYIEVFLKDGRVMVAKKSNDYYKTTLVDKGEGVYKAQVRIKDLSFGYRICLICEKRIPGDGIQCATLECEATYCPFCNRMLLPHSNYCPWDQKQIR
ncbi:MAG: hypothetical protein ACTSRZ_09280 [Promethearchaeota archaeon]